jgi:hypothetical protein
MSELLTFGGIIFWLIVAVLLIVVVIGTANESVLFPALALGGLAFILHKSGAPVAAYMPSVWYTWLLFVVAYLAIGAGWSMFRFYGWYKDRIEQIAEDKDAWLEWPSDHKYWPDKKDKNGNRTQISNKELTSEQQKIEWANHVDEHAPKAWNYKAKIFVWWVYWPFDMVYYVLFDLLRDLWEWLYSWVSQIFERIAQRLRDSIK